MPWHRCLNQVEGKFLGWGGCSAAFGSRAGHPLGLVSTEEWQWPEKFSPTMPLSPTPSPRCHHLFLRLCAVGVPKEGTEHRQMIGGTGFPSETLFLGGVQPKPFVNSLHNACLSVFIGSLGLVYFPTKSLSQENSTLIWSLSLSPMCFHLFFLSPNYTICWPRHRRVRNTMTFYKRQLM